MLKVVSIIFLFLLLMKFLDSLALLLVIVGGLNWGLVAFDFNLVSYLFGAVPAVEVTVYALVGLSALYLALAAIAAMSHHRSFLATHH